MSDAPFFSIITPNYNNEPYLEACLRSVARQKFTDFEHIVCNDASPNRAQGRSFKDILNETRRAYPDYKTKTVVIDNSRNQGVSRTRNAAIDKARGTFLVFLDGDDYLQPDFLQNLYTELQEYRSQWSQTVFNLYRIESFDSTSGQLNPQPLVAQKPRRPTIATELVFFSVTNPAMILAREFLGSIRYEPGIQFGEEPDLIFKLWARQREQNQAFLIQPLQAKGYRYRQHEAQYSTLHPEHEFENYRRLFATFARYPLSYRQKTLLSLAKSRYALYAKKTRSARLQGKVLTLLAKVSAGWWF